MVSASSFMAPTTPVFLAIDSAAAFMVFLGAAAGLGLDAGVFDFEESLLELLEAVPPSALLPVGVLSCSWS